jgi:hypothetical protein
MLCGFFLFRGATLSIKNRYEKKYINFFCHISDKKNTFAAHETKYLKFAYDPLSSI